MENVRSIVDNQETHSVVCDLSTPAGGSVRGPTALELSLMALRIAELPYLPTSAKRATSNSAKLK